MKMQDLKPGDVIIADAGFTCMSENEEYIVHEDIDGKLFVRCSQVMHYLDGLVGHNGEVIGFRRNV